LHGAVGVGTAVEDEEVVDVVEDEEGAKVKPCPWATDASTSIVAAVVDIDDNMVICGRLLEWGYLERSRLQAFARVGTEVRPASHRANEEVV